MEGGVEVAVARVIVAVDRAVFDGVDELFRLHGQPNCGHDDESDDDED